MSWNSGAQTARRDVVTDFRIFRIFEICGSESSFAPLEEIVRNARIDSMIIDQCMAIHSGIYLDSIILINHHQASFIPFAVETYGGLGKSARKLIKLIASAAEDKLQMLSEESVRKELRESVAIAVQRGNANIMLAEYHRAMWLMMALRSDETMRRS